MENKYGMFVGDDIQRIAKVEPVQSTIFDAELSDIDQAKQVCAESLVPDAQADQPTKVNDTKFNIVQVLSADGKWKTVCRSLSQYYAEEIYDRWETGIADGTLSGGKDVIFSYPGDLYYINARECMCNEAKGTDDEWLSPAVQNELSDLIRTRCKNDITLQAAYKAFRDHFGEKLGMPELYNHTINCALADLATDKFFEEHPDADEAPKSLYEPFGGVDYLYGEEDEALMPECGSCGLSEAMANEAVDHFSDKLVEIKRLVKDMLPDVQFTMDHAFDLMQGATGLYVSFMFNDPKFTSDRYQVFNYDNLVDLAKEVVAEYNAKVEQSDNECGKGCTVQDPEKVDESQAEASLIAKLAVKWLEQEAEVKTIGCEYTFCDFDSITLECPEFNALTPEIVKETIEAMGFPTYTDAAGTSFGFLRGQSVDDLKAEVERADAEAQAKPESLQANERGGSDYGPFAKQLADAVRADGFRKWAGWGRAFANMFLMCKCMPAYDLSAYSGNWDDSFKLQSKRVKATLNAIDNMVTKYIDDNRDNPSVSIYALLTQLAKASGDAEFIEFIDSGLNQFQEWGLAAEHDSDQDDTVESFVEYYLSDTFENDYAIARREFGKLISMLKGVDDGGFKANKMLVISQFESVRDAGFALIDKVVDTIKQEFPNGMQLVWGNRFFEELQYKFNNSYPECDLEIDEAESGNYVAMRARYDDEDDIYMSMALEKLTDGYKVTALNDYEYFEHLPKSIDPDGAFESTIFKLSNTPLLIETIRDAIRTASHMYIYAYNFDNSYDYFWGNDFCSDLVEAFSALGHKAEIKWIPRSKHAPNDYYDLILDEGDTAHFDIYLEDSERPCYYCCCIDGESVGTVEFDVMEGLDEPAYYEAKCAELAEDLLKMVKEHEAKLATEA